MRRLSHWLWLLVVSLIMLGCAPLETLSPVTTDAPPTTTLTVFAAASLTEAFTEIGQNFSAANPGVEVIFNFAGSQQLAQQIGQGAPVDIFASANGTQMKVAIESGRIITGTQRTFAHNRLVVITPLDNPAGVTTLQDLGKPRLKIVFAGQAVPVGQYSLDFLERADVDGSLGTGYREAVIANVVSYEENVRAVLAKVTLGEADAGIVYTSDIRHEAGDSTRGASEQVQRIDIPDPLNTIASYPIAPLNDSPLTEMAEAFIEYVLSPEGQQILVKYGFIAIAEGS